MIQNLLGNTSALKKKELQKKINDYKSNEIRNMDFLDKINYKSKNKFIGIKEKYNEEEEDENKENKKNMSKNKNIKNSTKL